MPILRITANWSGFRGAPGYSNFFFRGTSALEEDPVAAAEAVRTFFDSFKAFLPTGLRIEMSGVAGNIDETNGALVGEVNYAPPAAVLGAATGAYSAATGAVVNWNTSSYRNGRRVRGRTFVVPLAANVFDSQGDIASNPLTTFRNAASELVANPGPDPMVVWSRPKAGSPGAAAEVTSASVPDLGAILRSRRD